MSATQILPPIPPKACHRGRPKKTDEEKKLKRKEYNKSYYQNNKDRFQQWYQNKKARQSFADYVVEQYHQNGGSLDKLFQPVS